MQLAQLVMSSFLTCIVLLTLLSTFPVTTAPTERNFLGIKAYYGLLRSSTSKEGFTGMLGVVREESIIDTFTKKSRSIINTPPRIPIKKTSLRDHPYPMNKILATLLPRSDYGSQINMEQSP